MFIASAPFADSADLNNAGQNGFYALQGVTAPSALTDPVLAKVEGQGAEIVVLSMSDGSARVVFSTNGTFSAVQTRTGTFTRDVFRGSDSTTTIFGGSICASGCNLNYSLTEVTGIKGGTGSIVTA